MMSKRIIRIVVALALTTNFLSKSASSTFSSTSQDRSIKNVRIIMELTVGSIAVAIIAKILYDYHLRARERDRAVKTIEEILNDNSHFIEDLLQFTRESMSSMKTVDDSLTRFFEQCQLQLLNKELYFIATHGSNELQETTMSS